MKVKHRLPSGALPEGAKLKNGEEMNSAMVGAYYGSSYEFSMHSQLQICNGEDVECPADPELLKICKPKYAHGEFGAFKNTEEIPGSEHEISKTIVELSSAEEIKAVRESLDQLNNIPSVLKGWKRFYKAKDGRNLGVEQILALQESHRANNDAIQREKNRFLEERGLGPYFNGKRLVNPEYPKDVLEEIKRMNKKVWTATGVNLIIQLSGTHTIARDGKYYTGKLDQAGLDNLASKLDYKEADSFVKGKLRNARICIPIQTIAQLKYILLELSTRVNCPDNWPEEVRKSAIRLDKVKIKESSDSNV